MSFELAVGSVLDDRYQIKKVVSFTAQGGTYLAKDLRQTDRTWMVRELIPHPSLSEEAVDVRRSRFREVVEFIMHFDHPGIARILGCFSEARREYVVSEHVDGLTLEALCSMSVTALPEKQVLSWAQQICSAIAYMHERPRPFVTHGLNASRIVLTADERLIVTSFGLESFFTEAPPPVFFGEGPGEVLRDIGQFGHILGYLLTREHPRDGQLASSAHLAPETARFVTRCLQGAEQKSLLSFAHVQQGLQDLLSPVPITAAATPPPQAPRSLLPERWRFAVQDFVERFLAQTPARVAAEAAVVLGGAVALWYAAHPHYSFRRPEGAIAYLVDEEHALMTLALDTRQVVDRLREPFDVADVAVDPKGSWVYAADARTSRVLRIQQADNRPASSHAYISVSAPAQRLICDGRGTYMYATHPTTSLVSRIDLRREPPQMDCVVGVGKEPVALAASLDSKALYVANAGSRDLSVVEPEASKTRATVNLDATPTALALRPDGSELWVTCTRLDKVAILRTDTLSLSETLTEIGGSKPSDIVFTMDGNRAIVACEDSSSLVVLDVATRKVLKSIGTDGPPLGLRRMPDSVHIGFLTRKQAALYQLDTQTLNIDRPVPLPKRARAWSEGP